MRVSVVVPVYNSEETIGSCLEALVNQQGVLLGRDYDILVVDDGSDDATASIAKRYPVRVIKLGRNQGRILARKCGAEACRSSNILFVDSRVLLASDYIITLLSLDCSPVIVGNLMESQTKYLSVSHTFFYLVRRKVYGKEYFPQKNDELWITKNNFNHAPKGTTVLYIKKELFLSVLPKRDDKNVSDDILLFKDMIFDKGVSLLRHNRLRAEYWQRTDFKSLINWLFHRGVRFSDYYLRPGGNLFYPFIVMVSFFSILSLGLAGLVFAGSSLLIYFCCSVVALYVVSVVYLSENVRDFVTIFFVLPFMVIVFGAGVLKFWCLFLTENKKAVMNN